MFKQTLFCSLLSILSLTLKIHSEEFIIPRNYVHIECQMQPLSLTTKTLSHKKQLIQKGFKSLGLSGYNQTKYEISGNWCGYVATTKTSKSHARSVTRVSGRWNVPTLSPSITSTKTYSSTWIGIDGFSSPTVEQIGTEHDFSHGKQNNYAWFEMHPQGAFEIIGFPVRRNDQIGGEVKYVGNDLFKLTLVNYTRGVFTVIPSTYTKIKKALRNSAEWIVEAPNSSEGLLPLAEFSAITFTQCNATINGQFGLLNNRSSWKLQPILMKTQDNLFKAYPSSLTDKDSIFHVLWDHE